ncbi:hypothetical protein CVS40_1810 [Lucilia cuprina]|nr:hypothetical protein CVS40_1810 [Lucilia cuprina]
MLNSGIKIFLFLLILYQSANIINSQKTWTYELLELDFESSDKDFIDADLEVLRIARGVFGINGFIDIKQPIDESFSMEVIFFRDKYCQENYERQLYSVGKQSFADGMNKFYRRILMDSLRNCTTDAPIFDKFEPPLTKRLIVFDKCQISTDNLPSHVDDGCYLVKLNVYGKVEVNFSGKLVVERIFGI